MIRKLIFFLILTAGLTIATSAHAQRWCDHGYRTSVSGTIKEIRELPAFSMVPGEPKIKGSEDRVLYSERKFVGDCPPMTKKQGFSVKNLASIPANCRPGKRFVAKGTINVLEADPDDPEDEDIFSFVVEELVCQ